MAKKDVNMLSGSITKGLLAISIPVMVMNVLQSLFNIVDMTVLKTFDTAGGGSAVGAVGACGSLISMITGLVIGIATGANVITARYIGRGDRESIDRSVRTSIAFALCAGLALAVVGVLGAELFLTWSNCPEELLKEAILYFRLYFAGVPILMVYNFSAAILRSVGNSRGPMIYLTLGGIIKVACNLILVGFFHLGVTGVAIATILSWSVAACLALRALTKNQSAVKLQLHRIRFYQTEMKQVLHIGVPAGLQQALWGIANVVITATVNSFGPAATTGISIANNYDNVLYQISTAAAFAVTPYVSQNIGAGNVKRAKQAVWKGCLITVCLGASFGALSAIFSGPLSSIMSSDPEVIAYSQQKMVLISSTYFLCGIYHIFGEANRGMGKPMVATITTLLYMCVLRFVWVYAIFPLVPNLQFLYLVWPVGWVLSIVTLLPIMNFTAKKLERKMALPAEGSQTK